MKKADCGQERMIAALLFFINEEPINVVDDQNGLLSNSVKQIVCDSLGNYYIGTAEGLSVVSLSGGVKVTGSLDQIKKCSFDDCG